MKLLLISVKSTVSRGGIATWTERFLDKCGAHGMSCDLVNIEAVGKRAEQGTAKRNLKDEFVRTRRIFKDLKSCLKNKRYDAVHLNSSCGSFGLFRDYLIAKRIKKKKLRLIVHFHCDIPYWIKSSASQKYLGKLLALSDERLILCENSRVYLEKTYGVSSTKVPNFVDESSVLQSPKTIRETLKKVMFVGRISEAKGAEEIYALARLFPEISFCLIGDASNAVLAWEKPDNITLTGGKPHDEVLKYLNDADLFLFPSHSEGFSLALTEAMAMGVPAIATDVGANADMLADGCGMVVSVGDVDAMADAIRALSDPEQRRLMSERAVKKVREQYATDVIVETFKKYYQGN
ncbi:MAG: glycosyltransferase family 4 protein [Clostridia bacterium]|nr:glycosyltransferase family 4 protein [Clostridia bacterium]